MTISQAILLFFAAMIGGALNSVAGGGSFIVFPALLSTGAPPIEGNATNTVALWPGTIASAGAYRKELAAQRHILLLLGTISFFGGILGALILLKTKPSTFEKLLPYLLLVATLLFTFGGKVTAFVKKRTKKVTGPSWLSTAAVCLLQFVISIYGGFFGGGIGILMLATLALIGMEEIHSMNALKTILAALINGVAVFLFIWYGKVLWPQAIVMVVGAIIGGYGGAAYARKLNPGVIRGFVIAVGFTMTAVFFYRYGLHH